MALLTAEDSPRVTRLRVSLPLAVAGAVYLLLLALGNKLLNDPDTYWQIIVGQWIIDHRAFPSVDVFSYTMRGEPWISTQWLAQVLFAIAYAAAGWSGPVMLTAASVAAAYALLARFLLERIASLAVLVFATAGLLLAAPHLVARPHALVLPIMITWVGGLVRAVDRERAPSFALLPLIALWANMHGGFVLGLALLAPIALDALCNAAPSERLAVARRWFIFSVAALAAACATPYGWHAILATTRILGLGAALSLIAEWQPQDFSKLAGFELCLLAAIGFALYRGVKLPAVRIIVLLGLAHMALSHTRNGEVLGLLAPIFLAAPLAAQIGAHATAAPFATHSSMMARIAAGALAIALTWTLGAMLSFAPNPVVTPVRALAAVTELRTARVLNDYDFGGYLVWAGVAPFIDGRTELYGEAFVVRHHRALALQNLDDLLSLLDEYRIGVTLLNPRTPAVHLLDRLNGWQRVYADEVAVVHVRRPVPADAPPGIAPRMR